ncbi:hypothetical protein FACS189434_08030 [Bacteroidia bacterium]|nr:hypothetical protein FACS189434_08030 [Bacteroidia bacterium]
MSKQLADILKIIDSAPADFEKKIPAIEKKVFGDISVLLKDLKISESGKIEPSIENLNLINSIKGKLGKILLSKEYAALVKDFVANMPIIGNSIIATPNIGTDGKKMISEIARQQIDNTLESLIGAGYKQEMVSRLYQTLLTNVTSGGSYADLTEALRKTIITDGDSTGLINKYARTYVQDALATFAGQGDKIVAEKLNAEWFRYVGSNLTTTREFCEYLTGKEWFHVSEIPALLRGEIDGHQCEVYEKTGLPKGMKEETTPENFIVLHGGWNCRHRCLPMDKAAVPKNLRNKIEGNNSKKIVEKWANENIKNKDFQSENLYSGNIEITKSSIRNAMEHLTGKNKELVMMTIKNLDKWEKYEPNAPLKHSSNKFSAFNYYTLIIDNKKYIVQVGISINTGKEKFYTVFDMKKT